MRYIIGHIETILQTYTGQPPLAIWLKKYFKAHPKLGSRDRKAIASAVFIYYRNAAFYDENVPALALIFAETERGSFLEKVLQANSLPSSILPHQNIEPPLPLSEPIDAKNWLQSLKSIPDLFLRIRKNVTGNKQKLMAANISISPIRVAGLLAEETPSFRLPTATKVDTLLAEKDYVIQDASSQNSIALVLSWIQEQAKAAPQKVWDVCSGAGGKSIFLKDYLPPFQLLATDIRASVLSNLKQRFSLYEFKDWRVKTLNILDAPNVEKIIDQERFDLIICDVPCSGSGTWARTPERFHFFKPQSIQDFQKIQFPIVERAWPYLK